MKYFLFFLLLLTSTAYSEDRNIIYKIEKIYLNSFNKPEFLMTTYVADSGEVFVKTAENVEPISTISLSADDLSNLKLAILNFENDDEKFEVNKSSSISYSTIDHQVSIKIGRFWIMIYEQKTFNTFRLESKYTNDILKFNFDMTVNKKSESAVTNE